MTSSRLLSFQGGDLSTFWLLSRNQIAETKRLVPSGKILFGQKGVALLILGLIGLGESSLASAGIYK